jgi:hypothetical protein
MTSCGIKHPFGKNVAYGISHRDKKKRAPEEQGALFRCVCYGGNSVVVVEVMIVIMLVPITISVPAVGIFVPPTMLMFPAVGAGFGEFMTPMFGLRALRAVVLNGFMKLVICPGDALLTILVCANNRRSQEKEGGGKRYGSKRVTNPLRLKSHVFSKDEITRGVRLGRAPGWPDSSQVGREQGACQKGLIESKEVRSSFRTKKFQ